MFLLWHPSLTAINLSYTFPILETSATALCGTVTAQMLKFTASRRFRKRSPVTWALNPYCLPATSISWWPSWGVRRKIQAEAVAQLRYLADVWVCFKGVFKGVHSGKLTWQWEIHPLKRCNSCWKWWCSIAMFVYRSVSENCRVIQNYMDVLLGHPHLKNSYKVLRSDFFRCQCPSRLERSKLK